jgi:two-component system, OmpR family, KDP operon response regulator KdpE
MPAASKTNQMVLLVEDDDSMREFLQCFLSGYGYGVTEATTGQLALDLAAQSPPDLVLLDLRLPGMNGEDVLQKLREWYCGPIIVLSCLNQDDLKIFALDHGANDYLTKPFSSGELLARIRAALRISQVQVPTSEPVFQFGDLKIDMTTRRVQARGYEVRLTPTEYKVLTTLARHAGKVLTHGYLAQEVWNHQQATDNIPRLRVNMRNLRRKIEAKPHRPRHLLTEAGVGYRLATS